jgi:hypothetical protein
MKGMRKTICQIATLNAALVFFSALEGANADNPACERAESTIESEGFVEIQTIDCTGDFYVFTAWRLDSFYIIKVSGETGRIVTAEPQRLKPLWDQ